MRERSESALPQSLRTIPTPNTDDPLDSAEAEAAADAAIVAAEAAKQKELHEAEEAQAAAAKEAAEAEAAAAAAAAAQKAAEQASGEEAIKLQKVADEVAAVAAKEKAEADAAAVTAARESAEADAAREQAACKSMYRKYTRAVLCAQKYDWSTTKIVQFESRIQAYAAEKGVTDPKAVAEAALELVVVRAVTVLANTLCCGSNFTPCTLHCACSAPLVFPALTRKYHKHCGLNGILTGITDLQFTLIVD